MSAEFLLPPREGEERFSFIHYLLSEFQEEIEYQFETFSQRVSDGQQYMDTQWRSIAAIAGESSTASSDMDMAQQTEWLRVTTQWCAATEWLRLYGHAARLVLNGDAAQIDVSHPEIQPLWCRFAEQKRPQWATQWEALCKFSGWDEDLHSAGQNSPHATESLSPAAEPAGVNQSPFYDLPDHELNERYPSREDEDEPLEDGYDDDDEEDVDDRYASASPDEGPHAAVKSSYDTPPETARAFPLTRLVAQRLHPFLHRFIKQICARFSFNINDISVVAPDHEAWRILKDEDSGAAPPDDLEIQAALMPIRAQKALLEVCEWAERRGIQDELKIEEEFLGAFLPSYAPEIHDFDWRSSGASRIVAGEIEYEGGSEMPNDGFSIQTESRIQRPFDRD